MLSKSWQFSFFGESAFKNFIVCKNEAHNLHKTLIFIFNHGYMDFNNFKLNYYGAELTYLTVVAVLSQHHFNETFIESESDVT